MALLYDDGGDNCDSCRPIVRQYEYNMILCKAVSIDSDIDIDIDTEYQYSFLFSVSNAQSPSF